MRNPLARVLAGALALLVLAGVGSLAWGPMSTVMRYSVAGECGAEAAGDCVATRSATVTGTWNDFGEGEPYTTVLYLDVPGAPEGIARNPYDGRVVTAVDYRAAQRLRLVESDASTEVVDRIAVTAFDGEVVSVVVMGEPEPVLDGLMPRLAAAQFLVTLLVAAGLLAVGTASWRRRSGSGGWLAPAVGTAGTGAFVGLLATLVTGGHVAAGWTLPILGTALLAGVPVALLSVRTRESVAT